MKTNKTNKEFTKIQITFKKDDYLEMLSILDQYREQNKYVYEKVEKAEKLLVIMKDLTKKNLK